MSNRTQQFVQALHEFVNAAVPNQLDRDLAVLAEVLESAIETHNEDVEEQIRVFVNKWRPEFDKIKNTPPGTEETNAQAPIVL